MPSSLHPRGHHSPLASASVAGTGGSEHRAWGYFQQRRADCTLPAGSSLPSPGWKQIQMLLSELQEAPALSGTCLTDALGWPAHPPGLIKDAERSTAVPLPPNHTSSKLRAYLLSINPESHQNVRSQVHRKQLQTQSSRPAATEKLRRAVLASLLRPESL